MIPEATLKEIARLHPMFFPEPNIKAPKPPNGFSGAGAVGNSPKNDDSLNTLQLVKLLKGIEAENDSIQEEAAFCQAYC